MIHVFSSSIGRARRLVAACVVGFVGMTWVAAPEALGQERPVEAPSADQQRAEKLFKEGAEHFYAGEYAKALVKFKGAYAIKPNAMIMYNISLVHARIGNVQDALDAARQARGGKLPTKAAAQNNARIAALGRILAARKVVAAQKNVAAQKDVARSAGRPRVEPSTNQTSFGGVGWTGVTVAVVGAGSLVAAALTNSSLGGDLESYRRAANDHRTGRYRDLQSSIDSKQTYGQVFLFGGAGLVAVGTGMVVYELLDHPDSGSPSVSLGAALGAGRATVGVDVSY